MYPLADKFRAILKAIQMAPGQLALFGGTPAPRKPVQRPGSRGGRYYVSDTGEIVYGERPVPEAPAAPLFYANTVPVRVGDRFERASGDQLTVVGAFAQTDEPGLARRILVLEDADGQYSELSEDAFKRLHRTGETREVGYHARLDWLMHGTRAKSFKLWFGDWEQGAGPNVSKVVDEQGRPKETHRLRQSVVIRNDGIPITVYHGTATGGFTRFDPKAINNPESLLYGPGFYFTEHAEVAESYSYHGKRSSDLKFKGSATIRDAELFLNWLDGQVERMMGDSDVTSDAFTDLQDLLFAFHKEGIDVVPKRRLAGNLYPGIRFDIERPWGKRWVRAERDRWGMKRTRRSPTYSDGTRIDLDRLAKVVGDISYEAGKQRRLAGIIAEHLGVENVSTEAQRKVYGVYLNIRRPFVVDHLDRGMVRHIEVTREDKAAVIAAAAKIAREDLKGEALSDMERRHRDSLSDEQVLEQLTAFSYPYGAPTESTTYRQVYEALTKAFGKARTQRILQLAGFDGISHTGGVATGQATKHRVWIAFKPQQVKAVDNVGTFSRTSADIYKARQLGLFPGFEREVQEPGIRGGKFYVTQTGHIRYGEKPLPEAPAEILSDVRRAVVERRLATAEGKHAEAAAQAERIEALTRQPTTTGRRAEVLRTLGRRAQERMNEANQVLTQADPLAVEERQEVARTAARTVALGPQPDPKTAAKLRASADGLQATIDAKLDPGIGHQNVTARRSRIAAGMHAEGWALQQIQGTLRNLADAFEDGSLPVSLRKVTNRARIQTLIASRWVAGERVSGTASFPQRWLDRDDLVRLQPETLGLDGLVVRAVLRRPLPDPERPRLAAVDSADHDQIEQLARVILRREDVDKWDARRMAAEAIVRGSEEYRRAADMGLDTPAKWAEAQEAIKPYLAELGRPDPIKEAERALIGRKIPGYFPTPAAVSDQVVELAEIEPGMRVLEPSAGKGNLADAVKRAHPDADLECLEINSDLRDILILKGHKLLTVAGQDFLQLTATYDRIVMNPPFEGEADIAHIRHAYNLLNPGGRLVSIMSEHGFFSGSKNSEAFRGWLDELGGTSQKLPTGSFMSSERPTGVSTRIVVLDKPGVAESPIQLAKARLPANVAFLLQEKERLSKELWYLLNEDLPVASEGIRGAIQSRVADVQRRLADVEAELVMRRGGDGGFGPYDSQLGAGQHGR